MFEVGENQKPSLNNLVLITAHRDRHVSTQFIVLSKNSYFIHFETLL